MTFTLWIILCVLHLLTLAWYFLIRRDVLSYTHTQIKLLGAESTNRINNSNLRFLTKLYAFVLFLMMTVFTLYLLALYA